MKRGTAYSPTVSSNTYKTITDLTEVQKTLNPDFLLQIVAIESIQYYSQVDDLINKFKFTSLVELNVVVIEPTQESTMLSENIYSLELLNVDKYNISFGDNDGSIFEFDTDEITLEINEESKSYILRFKNAFTSIEISFNQLTIKLISQRALIED